MKLIALVTTFLCTMLPYADFREYHYTRPQMPLSLPHHSNLGPQIPNYRNSKAQARLYAPPSSASATASAHFPQTSATTIAILKNYGHSGVAKISRQLPLNPATTRAVNGGNYASAVAASYYPQQKTLYSPFVNPLTHNSKPKQTTYVVQVQSPQQHYNQQYGVGGQQHQHQHRQQQQLTANNNGGSSVFGQSGQTLPLNGNFVSQSEIGQLHSYQHQQSPSGNVVPFSRQVRTCYPNGQCESTTLGAGQVDQRHKHIVEEARAKVVPASNKCRLIAEAQRAAVHGYLEFAHSHEETEQIQRPPDRRLFPYSEVELPSDPYN